jgi:formylglycine-generating enzyme required for sulfatase activity
MKRMMTWSGMPSALVLVLAAAGAVAAGPEITSFSPGDGRVVFRTPGTGTSDHSYRVESSTSLVAAAWTVQATAGGVGASASVTNLVTVGASAMFYRVVATSNSAAFVDGPYMAIDLSGGTNAASYPVAYYRTLANVPGGPNSDAFKTTNLLMRLIPKGTVTMGSPAGELGRDSDETQHRVTLTKDFYIGVFEVTQRQWELVMGNKPSYFTNVTYYATRPVEQVSYYDIRENPANSDDAAVNWPANSAVNAASFMGKLRTKTGLATFDLPTESQWEYACRAGTATALNSGKKLTSSDSDANMAEVGRYWYNGGSGYGYNQSATPSAGTAAADSYLPNAWGLYDMHGNVWEWCLDWYGTYPGSVQDPPGAASESRRVGRGGSWNKGARESRSAYRSPSGPNLRDFSIGFRVARTLP